MALYWRIQISSPAPFFSIRIYEMEFRATVGGADITDTDGGSAFGSSSDASHPPAHAFDNVLVSTNYYHITGSDSTRTIGWNFAVSATPAELAISVPDLFGSPYDGPEDFVIQYSDNNIDWVTTDTYTGVTWPTTPATQTFAITDPNVYYDIPSLSFGFSVQPLRYEVSFPALARKTPVFICLLTGDADATTDLTIPISSFQSIMRQGEPSSLSVVIPTLSYASDIESRLNGDIVVQFGFRNEDTGELLVSEIARANLDDVRTDQGARNQSITLRGYKQQTFSPVTKTLTGVTYRAVIEGKRRFRTDIDEGLRPGDTAVVGAESIVVNNITYTVDVTRQIMEISE